MRLVELKDFLNERSKLDLRFSIVYGTLFGGLLFIFVLLSGEFIFGLLSGAFMFGVVFVLIMGIRKTTHKAMERKRRKIDFDAPYLDVTIKGEAGALMILDDKIKYFNLTPGGGTKDFELPINEDLFMVFGDIKFSKFRKLRYGDLREGHITVRPMPHGIIYQFVFLKINGLYDIVGKRVEEVNVFNAEKHQL